MTTKIKAQYVLAQRGEEQVLLKDGVVVYDDQVIQYVGADDGRLCDVNWEEPEALLAPGFIDLDALGDIDHALIFADFPEERRSDLNWSNRYFENARSESLSAEEEAFKSLYAYVCLIQNGVTTAMPITSVIPKKSAETYGEIVAAAEHAGKLGLRVYLGPSYLSAKHVLDDKGQLSVRAIPEEEAQEAMAAAERFIRQYGGAYDGLINAVLVPERIEQQTEASLRWTVEKSKQYHCPVRLHAAQGEFEQRHMRSTTGLDSLHYLDSIGFLTERTLIPHTIISSGNPAYGDMSDDDQLLLIERGTSVIHCPLVYARSGHMLHSFGRYRRLGVKLSMGSDTFPPDMIENIKIGSALARSVDDNRPENSLAEFYRAATLGGAEALGRKDLGRLEAGAQADMILFDLGKFEIGQIDDPLKTILVNGHGNFVKSSVIAGRTVMKDRVIPGVELPALKAKAQSYYDKMKESYRLRSPHPEREPFFPTSLPVVSE